MTKFWIVTRSMKNDTVGFDTQDEVLVEAETEERARAIAQETARDEGKGVWLEPTTTAKELHLDGVEGLIMQDCSNA